jgi:hypothetical protein
MCVSIYISKCNIQHLNSDFNKLKVDDLIHVKILIVQEMWKNSLNHWSIIVIHWIACVLVNYGKYKMQLLSNGFNMLIVDNWKNVKNIINPL